MGISFLAKLPGPVPSLITTHMAMVCIAFCETCHWLMPTFFSQFDLYGFPLIKSIGDENIVVKPYLSHSRISGRTRNLICAIYLSALFFLRASRGLTNGTRNQAN